MQDLSCIQYQPHAMRFMELYGRGGGGEGIEGLYRGLHSDYLVSRESPLVHLCTAASSEPTVIEAAG